MSTPVSTISPPPAPATASPTIKACNFSHDAIALWLVANPGGKQKECAEHFGYTQAWLSIIIHSDAFQARYRELLGQADASVINDIPAKMRGVASRALDGLAEAVEVAVESDQTIMHRGFLLETSDKLLRDLGYGPQKPTVQINNPVQNNTIIGVDSDTLARARQKMLSLKVDTSSVVDVLAAPAT